jgi:hypothetical protein
MFKIQFIMPLIPRLGGIRDGVRKFYGKGLAKKHIYVS